LGQYDVTSPSLSRSCSELPLRTLSSAVGAPVASVPNRRPFRPNVSSSCDVCVAAGTVDATPEAALAATAAGLGEAGRWRGRKEAAAIIGAERWSE
jgi:hypothetical protein